LNEVAEVLYILTMQLTNPKDFQEAFFRQHPLAITVIELFDALPNVYFFAKDRNSQYIKVNHAFLENHGLPSELEAIGKTDRDFHPALMAEAYIEEDRRVMSSGEPLPGQVWLVLHRRRIPHWYISTKTPIRGASGEVVGIAGAMYRIQHQHEQTRQFHELLPVVQHIEKHLGEAISMKDMAALAGMSSTHFNRCFKQLLRMTPMEYLHDIRIQAAKKLLSSTSNTIAEIAVDLGYNDQSHFTRRFRQVTGVPPATFRKRFVK